MQNNNRNPLILASAIILLFVAPACFADLMCYVCDDCATLQKDATLVPCNEDYFNQGGSTEASTITTTTTSSTTELTESSSSSTDTTTTPVTETSSEAVTPTEFTETTTMDSTTEQSTETTEVPMPTPATVGPPETTAGVPTPPIEGLLSVDKTTRRMPVEEQVNPTTTEPAIRQRRALINTTVSYHCYTVQKTVNKTVSTERGCSRVAPLQSVCKELEVINNDIQLAHCDPCTMNACNGATSLLQSSLLATLLFAAVAAALQRN